MPVSSSDETLGNLAGEKQHEAESVKMDVKPQFVVGSSLSEIFHSQTFDSDNIGLVYYDDVDAGDCLQKINDTNADIVIVDIRGGKGSGFKLCEALQANREVRDVFIFVVSDSNELALKLKSYNVGAHGFYGGSNEPTEIKAELMAAYSYVNRTRELKTRLKHASETVRQIITSSDELVAIIDFFESLSSCHTIDELISNIFVILKSFGLRASLQIRSAKKTINCPNGEFDEIVNPLEIELFEVMKDEGRILDLGKRLMFNFKKISLLVKNPPIDGDKLGRYRDHLAIILRCAETKIKAIEIEEGRRTENQSLKTILGVATQILPEIDQKQLDLKNKMIAVNEDLLNKLTSDFMVLGLDENQEEHLLGMVQTSLDQSLQFFDSHREDEQVLRNIVEDLNELLRKSLDAPIEEQEDEDEDFSDGGVMFL